jgi:hypothetical protein
MNLGTSCSRCCLVRRNSIFQVRSKACICLQVLRQR